MTRTKPRGLNAASWFSQQTFNGRIQAGASSQRAEALDGFTPFCLWPAGAILPELMRSIRMLDAELFSLARIESEDRIRAFRQDCIHPDARRYQQIRATAQAFAKQRDELWSDIHKFASLGYIVRRELATNRAEER